MMEPRKLDDLATTADKRAHLQALLRQIVGSTPRKEALLRSPGTVQAIVAHLTPHSDPNEDLSTEAAAVLAAVSLPTLESVTVFAGPSHAYEAVTKGFVRVYSEYPPTHFSLAVYQKRLDVHLRALKTLFIDLLAASRPHGDYGLPSRDSRSGKYGKGVGAKGKEKEGDVKMSDEVEAEESIEALTQRVSSIVYDLGPASTTSTAYPGPSGFSSVPSTSRLSPTLDALLELLDDASRPDHPGSRLSGTSQRMRIADHVCALLSRTIQGYQERQSIAAGGKGKQTLAALRRLVEVGSEKVKEGVLNALTAIIRDSHVALLALLELGGSGSTAERLQPFFSHAQSQTPSIRLAAITFCATASKLQPSSSPIAIDPAILLALIEKEPTLRGPAAQTFAYLVSKDPDAQRRAVSANCFATFRKVMEGLPSLVATVQAGVTLEDDVRTRKGILDSLASLTADSELNRRFLLDARLLRHVISSLQYPVVSVRIAACQVVRALSRSVNVLRTDFVEGNAEGPLIQLLANDEDEQVQQMATAVFANLLLEFSPMRKGLIEAGCIPRLCRLALDGDNEGLKQNALWAIKNAVYQSSKSFKQTLLQDLTWQQLALLSDPSQSSILVEQALGIIRNITCVTHNEVLDALDDYGEDEVLDLLQRQFAVGNAASEAVIESLYCLNNIATAGEASQLAIASRTPLLRYLLYFLDHPSARTRTASLWVIHNLVYRRGSPSLSNSPRLRRPHEIVEKFRVLGIEGKLRSLERDPELDVRERVRDIKDAM
ncbi:hypothetical protein JCM16303_003138 [Sporobolomyces ruberrimus]